MKVISTSLIDDNKYESIGLVTGISVRSLSFFRRLLGGLQTIFGGKMELFEEKLVEARVEAIQNMISRAKKMEADEVIGVNVEMSEIASGRSDAFLVCSCYGTAVKLKK